MTRQDGMVPFTDRLLTQNTNMHLDIACQIAKALHCNVLELHPDEGWRGGTHCANPSRTFSAFQPTLLTHFGTFVPQPSADAIPSSLTAWIDRYPESVNSIEPQQKGAGDVFLDEVGHRRNGIRHTVGLGM